MPPRLQTEFVSGPNSIPQAVKIVPNIALLDPSKTDGRTLRRLFFDLVDTMFSLSRQGATSARHDSFTTQASGPQNINLPNATFVWSVGLKGVNGTFDLLDHGTGWTFTPGQIQLLKADLAAQAVVRIVHNGASISSAATTPTGTFNLMNRIYTVDIGSYPLSRLLVETDYTGFVPATTLDYQVPNTYLGPSHWRFKIAAEGQEAESDVLDSPAFLAPGALIDLFILLLGIIQSNGTGFAHLNNLSAAELAAINNFLISVFTDNPTTPQTNPKTYAGSIAAYQAAVNGEGIKKILVDPNGTDARYQDGFGLDMQYGQRVKASGITEAIIKKNITRGVTTDNASLGKWNQFLYPEYKEEILQAYGNFRALGYNPIPKWLVLDVRESSPATVPDYVAGYQALIQKFQDDGLINEDTKFVIIYPFTSNSVNDTARQDALYATNPSRFLKVQVGVQPTIDGTHGDDVAMRAIGNEVYNVTHGKTTPPVVVVPPTPGSGTITDQEPTGPRTSINYSPAVYGLFKTASNNYCASPGLQSNGQAPNTSGLQDAYLAANTSGLVYFQFKDANAINGAVGFHTSPNRVPLGAMAYGCYPAKSGKLATVENGAGADTTLDMVFGYFYGVKRVANTGKIKVVYTADDTLPAEQWATVKEYNGLNTGALYSGGHLFDLTSQIQNPKSQSLTALVVPTPTGKLEFHTGYNDSTSGGVALIDLDGSDLTELTFWFLFTPSQLGTQPGYSGYQELIGFGENGGQDEGFAITEFPDGGLSMRVHTQNNGYAYSTGGTGQNNGVLLAANTEVLIVGRISAGTLRMWVGGTATPLVNLPGPMLQTSSQPFHIGGTLTSNGRLTNQTSGIYGRLGIATRAFSDAEVAQVQAANGAISTIAGTVRLFEFNNMLNSTSVVQDTIDPTKTALIYQGTL